SVSMHQSAARRRIEAVLAGEASLDTLDSVGAAVFNAEIDTAIDERATRHSFGSELAAAGIVTVALNDAGELIEHHPDGSTVQLSTPAATG
ncbi:MAG: hypothetical protein ACRD1G_02295, partial [Acidimicrobiales bacterium]